MRFGIRLLAGMVLVFGLLRAHEKLSVAADTVFESIFDDSTYPEYPDGKKWEELPYEYRKQYWEWFWDEVFRRIQWSATYDVMAFYSAYVGVPAVVIWVVFGLRRRPAGLQSSPGHSPQQFESSQLTLEGHPHGQVTHLAGDHRGCVSDCPTNGASDDPFADGTGEGTLGPAATALVAYRSIQGSGPA